MARPAAFNHSAARMSRTYHPTRQQRSGRLLQVRTADQWVWIGLARAADREPRADHSPAPSRHPL